jgi:hypothetical protein
MWGTPRNCDEVYLCVGTAIKMVAMQQYMTWTAGNIQLRDKALENVANLKRLGDTNTAELRPHRN